jgi:hypothetical protein
MFGGITRRDHFSLDTKDTLDHVYNHYMKPLPAPNVPGKTEFERFDNAVRQVLTVSKEELLKREAQEKKTREGKGRPKKS